MILLHTVSTTASYIRLHLRYKIDTFGRRSPLCLVDEYTMPSLALKIKIYCLISSEDQPASQVVFASFEANCTALNEEIETGGLRTVIKR